MQNINKANVFRRLFRKAKELRFVEERISLMIYLERPIQRVSVSWQSSRGIRTKRLSQNDKYLGK